MSSITICNTENHDKNEDLKMKFINFFNLNEKKLNLKINYLQMIV